MTESLYLKDAYLKEIWAKVVAVEGKKVLTEKTIFSPKTTEQAGDTGFFDGIPVLGVLKQGEETWHMLETEPKLIPGGEALLKLNWKKRHHSLRLHTALHLLSQIMKREFRKYASELWIDEEGAHLEFVEQVDIQTINQVLTKANEMVASGAVIEIYNDSVSGKPAINIGYLPKFECNGLFIKDIKEIGSITFIDGGLKNGKFEVTINVENA